MRFEDSEQQVIEILNKEISPEEDPLLYKFLHHFIVSLYERLNDECIAQLVRRMYKFVSSYSRDGSLTELFSPSKGDAISNKFTVIKTLNLDMPFLVDSITEAIKALGVTVYHRVNIVLGAKRKDDKLVDLYFPSDSHSRDVASIDVIDESVVCFFVGRLGEDRAEEIESCIASLVQRLSVCVRDWRSMLKFVNELKGEVASRSESVFDEVANKEASEFLGWLTESNFVFLGTSQFHYKEGEILPVGEALGMLTFSPHSEHFDKTTILVDYSYPIYITRSRVISEVHRRVNLDFIRVPLLSGEEIIGESIIVGLFTANAYFHDVTVIPIIGQKVKVLQNESYFPKHGHSSKALIAILQSFPRAELFHIPHNDLLRCCTDIMSLSMHPRLKLFVFYDKISSYIRCIIFLPRKEFTTPMWLKMQKMISEYFDCAEILDENVRGSGLTRLQVILSAPKHSQEKDIDELEKNLSLLLNGWGERLRWAVSESFDQDSSDVIVQKYMDAFTEGYKQSFDVKDALYDIRNLEDLSADKAIATDLYVQNDEYQLKVYLGDRELSLSDMIPVIENMGMRVIGHNSYKVSPSGGDQVFWIHTFYLVVVGAMFLEIEEIKDQFENSLALVWQGEMENDYYNSLVILAGLHWREVVLIRALGKYLKQIRFLYSEEQVKRTLAYHPGIVSCLVQLFHAKFDPAIHAKGGEGKEGALINKVEKFLKKVDSLVDDVIIRRMLNLVLAMLRTNYYLNKDYVSFKFDSAKIIALPLPRPRAEIYVYSTRFEAVHLRGGKVARGGLRWSDRFEDFRTEILGLLKAQMPKNTVIVPVGSKGGFVVKVEPGGDAKQHREVVIGCYQDFLRALLDITDNIVSGVTEHPKDIVCCDDLDPYLVIAADKGTATFSDYANAVSAEYNFWLADAYASGGSSGYDHKAMGITARGAWVAVERHFWEMRRDIYSTPFTVVGIGDMAGDVFGNGMLLSDQIQLVAAFNHVHIFLDPDPKPDVSFNERRRLFENPSLTWDDYDKSIISKGGGVFSRRAKSIAISDEIRNRFSIPSENTNFSPDDLIKYLLKSGVDLIWNGGIGTFVMSSSENNEMVGDKANDNIRVLGKELNAKIFAEGGNLGLTQLGRIEFAMKGGRINTDFIDNSAGVSCSDMEVNIKIALASAVEKEKLSLEKRNELLAKMEDEVGTMILRKYNDLQTKSLTVQCLQASYNRLEQYQRLMFRLEKSGLLNREVEFLPSDEDMVRMRSDKRGFTRPQLAVLTAYAKMHFNNIILCSDLPDQDYFSRYLVQYFPSTMQEEYREEILAHPLRKEIIATYIINSIIHRMGCTFVDSLVENTGLSETGVVRIYMAIRESYDLRGIWSKIDALDDQVALDTYSQMIDEVHKFVRQATEWFFRNYPKPVNISLAIEEFKGEAKNIANNLSSILDQDSLQKYQAKIEDLVSSNVPEGLAVSIANLAFLGASLSITHITNNLRFHGKLQVPSLTVGRIYFYLGDVLHLEWLRTASAKLESGSYWHKVSIRTLADDIHDKQMLITAEVAKHLNSGGEGYMSAIKIWQENNADVLDRYHGFFAELKTGDSIDLSRLIVIIRRLGNIC